MPLFLGAIGILTTKVSAEPDCPTGWTKTRPPVECRIPPVAGYSQNQGWIFDATVLETQPWLEPGQGNYGGCKMNLICKYQGPVEITFLGCGGSGIWSQITTQCSSDVPYDQNLGYVVIPKPDAYASCYNGLSVSPWLKAKMDQYCASTQSMYTGYGVCCTPPVIGPGGPNGP